MNYVYVATDSNAGGVIVEVPDQDGEDVDLSDTIDLIDDINVTDETSIGISEAVDFQIILLLTIGIIIGILLVGDRRF